MKPFEWVSEGSLRKFDRAVLQLKNENKELVAQGKSAKEITEEAIKALYVKWNGLVLDEKIETEEGAPTIAVDEPVVRRGRPVRNVE